MTSIDLLLWAAHRGYPQLVLADGSVLRAGLEAWENLLRRQDENRTSLVVQRIGQWNELLKIGRADTPILLLDTIKQS